jgi:UDP-glucose 4-epimerase
MKVLVAGGFGFVGARLSVALYAAGHDVVLGSRRARPVPAWLPQAGVCETRWESLPALQAACEGMDVVVHAAGMNSGQSALDPAAALQFNGVGTTRLVEAAAASGVSRFFYFSTAHVYANPLQGIIDENSCARNVHPYASSHLAGEQALLHAISRERLSGSVLRLSNGFGPPKSPDADCWMLLVNDLCRQAVTTRRLVLQSSGEQLRDFVPLTSVCETVARLLELPPQTLPPVLNICNGISASVAEMARLVQKRCAATLGYSPTIEPGARKEVAVPLRLATIHELLQGLVAHDPESEVDQLLVFCSQHFTHE